MKTFAVFGNLSNFGRTKLHTLPQQSELNAFKPYISSHEEIPNLDASEVRLLHATQLIYATLCTNGVFLMLLVKHTKTNQ
jgi:hypothetical protein